MAKKGNNEGSIRKRSNGTWEGRYSDGVNAEGKQIQRSVYGKTKKEVADKLHAIFFQKQQGIYVTPTKVLVKDWLIEWLHNYAHITVRPSTYISYEGYIYNHIIPIIGNLPIQKLTPPIVQNFYNDRFLNGRIDGKGGLSSKTLRNMHNMFHQAMEQAKINGLIMQNPTDNAIIPKSQKKEMRVLSVQEQLRLLNVVHLHRLGFAIKFDLATGLRIGELCALKWTDLNYQKKTVKISRTLQRIKTNQLEREELDGSENMTMVVEGDVKTSSGFREIPIPDKIWMELLQHQQRQQQEYMSLGVPILPDGYIFAMPFGTCVEPSTMRDALNYLLAVAEIEHANFHSLRHTFATRAIEAGMPVKTLSDILGHSQVQITMDLYCHSSIDHMRDSMNALMGMF